MISADPQLSHLVLGTAQLGMAYGIANVSGKPSDQQAEGLIAAAWRQGIRYFDTAQAYGDSEIVLGNSLTSLSRQEQPRIITKLHPAIKVHDSEEIEERVRSSLDRLRVPSLWGLLLHREDLLDQWSHKLGSTLRLLKQKGIIQHLGTSVYRPERAIQALDCPDMDFLQVALSVFDRRMARTGVLAHAQKLGKTIFVRSLYLQGLALMNPEDVPPQIPHALKAVQVLDQFCRVRGLERREFILTYVRHLAPRAYFVIGAETAQQVVQNTTLFNQPCHSSPFVDEWTEEWKEDFELLINPSLWPTLQ